MRSLRWRRSGGLAVAAALTLGSGLVGMTLPASAAEPSCTGYVGLTFDDGPTPGNTAALLDALKASGLRATMFNTGQNVQANPELAKAQVSAGMWLANHSWDHPHMLTLSADEQASQISRAQDVIKEVTGITPQLFRPPYLETDDALRAVERRFGLTEINTDVDSKDWDNVSVDAIVAAAGQLQAGQVILMHDWPPNTVQAIPGIAAGLRGRGLCAGRISPETGRAIAPDGTTPPTPPTSTTVPPTTPGPSGACTATYRAVNSWGGGFQGEVVVRNGGTAALRGWKVTLTLPASAAISSLWNGVGSGTSGTVTVTNVGYNGTVAPGQSTAFGFTATGNGAGTTATCADTSTPATMPPTTAPATSAPPTSVPPTSAPPTTVPTSVPPTTPPSGSVLDRVHTVGRVRDEGTSVRYTWPGVYFEGRFRGTGVGVVLDDSTNDYEVQIDDATPVTVRKPGRTTHWITGLSAGEHTVRLAKRTESPWAAGQFGGFVVRDGGTLLAAPAARGRQIEFIGDSWTAGYGNMSTNRDCSGSGGIDPNSNADQTFGALTARELDADYQINAWSGRGMVRNYNGGDAGTTFRTYYERTLQAVDTGVWQKPAGWKPAVVVVGLGINDFSTALNPGEPWADAAALATDYRNAYLGFVDTLRKRYGSDTQIVLTYPTLWNTSDMADSIEQVVRQRNSAGDGRISALHYDNDALGLDLLGCDWHPSLHDHKALAGALGSYIESLPVKW